MRRNIFGIVIALTLVFSLPHNVRAASSITLSTFDVSSLISVLGNLSNYLASIQQVPTAPPNYTVLSVPQNGDLRSYIQKESYAVMQASSQSLTALQNGGTLTNSILVNPTITGGIISGATFSGTITSGLVNSQTISSAANFTGSLTMNGAFANTSASNSYFTGNVGIGTTSPGATLDVNGATQSAGFIGTATGNTPQLSLTNPANGSRYVWLSQSADTAKAPFGVVMDTTLFGSTYDEGMCIGYNCAPGGGLILAAEPSFRWKTEQDYAVGAAHYVESYFEWFCAQARCGGAGNQQRRPLFWQIDRSNGNMTGMEIRSPGVSFSDWDSGAVFATLGSTALYINGNPTQSGDTTLSVGAQNGKAGLLALAGGFQVRRVTPNNWAFDISGVNAAMEFITGKMLVFSDEALGSLTVKTTVAQKDNIPTVVVKQTSGQTTRAFEVQDSSGNRQFIQSFAGVTAIPSGGIFKFSSTTDAAGSADTGFARNAAGVVEINSGTAGTYRDLQVRAINPSSGNVGIGTTNPGQALTVAGSVGLPGIGTGAGTAYLCTTLATGVISTSTSACAPSSIKYKNNVQMLADDRGLDLVLRMRPVTYTYKPELLISGNQVGFIAEDMAPLIPEVVGLDASGTPANIDYAKLTPILTKAIQELSHKLDLFTGTSSSTQTVIDNSGFLSDLAYLGGIVEGGIVHFVELIVDHLRATTVTTSHLEIKDDDSSQLYCVRMKSGNLVSTLGECGTSASSGTDSSSTNSSNTSSGSSDTTASSTDNQTASSTSTSN